MKWYDRLWYQAPRGCAWPLLPISLLYRTVLFCEARRNSFFKSKPPVVPVVVVGNLSVGGTGKTPLVIYLVKRFQAAGVKVGVVSRGYGGLGRIYDAMEVNDFTTAQLVGDEPKLIHQQTHCPLAVGKDLAQAMQLLLEEHSIDLIVSDDGLQHHRLPRTLEVAAIDGSRAFGNRYVLPAGPLREPLSRLESVDFVIVNGQSEAQHSDIERILKRRCHRMHLQATSFYTPVYEKHYAPDHLKGQRVHACAALANSERFFASLESLGVSPVKHIFKDHHAYRAADFKFKQRLPIVMTTKDAVKWVELAEQGHKLDADVWVLHTQLQIDEDFERQLFARLGYEYRSLPAEHQSNAARPERGLSFPA